MYFLFPREACLSHTKSKPQTANISMNKIKLRRETNNPLEEERCSPVEIDLLALLLGLLRAGREDVEGVREVRQARVAVENQEAKNTKTQFAFLLFLFSFFF